jgi:hypothetical protein
VLHRYFRLVPTPPRRKRSRNVLLPLVYSSGLLILGGALVDRLERDAEPVDRLPSRVDAMVAGATAPQPPRTVAVEVAVPVLALRPRSALAARTEQSTAVYPEKNPASDGQVEPVPDPDPDLLTEDLDLIATAKMTWVYRKPDRDSSKLGYLRTGAVVRRGAAAVAGKGCKEGWYRVEPAGYVCVGEQASLQIDPALASATARRPERDAALPYHYGRSRNPPPHFYSRVPTVEEQREAEPTRDAYLKLQDASPWQGLLSPMPEFLHGGQPSLRHNGARQSALVLSDGQAVAKSGFALLTLFEADGRSFGLTTDLSVVPLDRLERVQASRFHGLPLSESVTLPVVFNRGKQAFLYEGDPKVLGLKVVRPLDDREALSISGRSERVQGKTYLETKDGNWVIDQRLLRVDPLSSPPSWLHGDQDWIDVSLQAQVLVAYQGTQPIFVTLVSTGVDGMQDPQTTHSTVQGEFRIHTKHVTTTMDSDQADDEYDLRDVPYVQYFHEGYALHGVYWHDGFGTPRSHGCINLSPLDARWLFGWTSPTVPSKWHGALSHHEGTIVSIHP